MRSGSDRTPFGRSTVECFDRGRPQTNAHAPRCARRRDPGARTTGTFDLAALARVAGCLEVQGAPARPGPEVRPIAGAGGLVGRDRGRCLFGASAAVCRNSGVVVAVPAGALILRDHASASPYDPVAVRRRRSARAAARGDPVKVVATSYRQSTWSTSCARQHTGRATTTRWLDATDEAG